MQKIFPIAVGFVAIVFIGFMLAAIPGATESFRTDLKTQEYTVATAVGTTTANVSLAYALWNDTVTEVTSLASDDTSDSPVAANYTSASRALNITGLAENTTRTISLSYRTAGLDAYAGADQGATYVPGVVVGLFVIIPLALIAFIFIGRR